jgi:hypothetical protein
LNGSRDRQADVTVRVVLDELVPYDDLDDWSARMDQAVNPTDDLRDEWIVEYRRRSQAHVPGLVRPRAAPPCVKSLTGTAELSRRNHVVGLPRAYR